MSVLFMDCQYQKPIKMLQFARLADFTLVLKAENSELNGDRR